MKKVRFLLLSMLALVLFTFATSCQVAGDSCEKDSDCTNEKDSCYAGYCGQQEPTASVNLKFNIRDSVKNEAMTCAEANVDKVDVSVSAHGFDVAKTTVACKDLNVHEIEDSSLGYEISHLWPNKDYEIKVKFTDSVTKEFTAIPQIGGISVPSEKLDANIVKLDLALKATLTVKWNIDDGFGGQITECGDISSFRIAMGGLEACDDQGVCDFSDYTSIPCTDEWSKTYSIHQSNVDEGSSLNIYATKLTDAGVKVLYQDLEKDFRVSQSQLESGAFERTFTLKALGNK